MSNAQIIPDLYKFCTGQIYLMEFIMFIQKLLVMTINPRLKQTIDIIYQ